MRSIVKQALAAAVGCCLSHSVLAQYDILLENNTTHPIYIDTLAVDSLSSSAYGGWHQQRLNPYQRAKVQWFNYNDAIKSGHHYRFQIKVHRQLNKAPVMTLQTTVKGDFLGSHITKSEVLLANSSHAFFTSNPKPNYSRLFSQTFANFFGATTPLTIDADVVKYLVPNPHKNYQSVDMISYSINEPQQQYSVSNTPFELTALSYNTQLWPVYGRAGGMQMNQAANRASDIPKQIKHYDVVAVQEVMSKEHRATLTQAMLAEYPHFAGPIKDIRPLSSGVRVFSRWPITYSDSHVYAHCYNIDCGAAKGLTYVRIDKLGMPYHLFATHLQASTEDLATDKKALNTRQKQILEAHAYIQSQAIPKNEPVLFLGDLNIDASRCLEHNDCSHLNFLLKELNAAFIPHLNQKTLPYTNDSALDWMIQGKSRKLIDYILPLKAYLPYTSYQSRVLVLRGFSDANMYSGTPYGDTDLSDHFAIEAKISYG